MPRRARSVIPGVAHHITQRGNNRQPVFFSQEDRRFYLRLLGRHAMHHGMHVLGYCLMTNHVHLVAVPDTADSLARTLGRVHCEYALAVNCTGGRSGHLWQNRYYSCPLDQAHLMSALRYADLNPVRAGLAPSAWDWPWSSARAHALVAVHDEVLDCRWTGYIGGWDWADWKEGLAIGMPRGDVDMVRRATHTGEPLGSRGFISQLELQAGRRLRVLGRGRPRKVPQPPEEAASEGLLFAGRC